MKIGIVSDSHDNLPNVEKALAHLNRQNVSALIHCGDVCAPATLAYFAQHFPKPIHLCFGNVDGDQYNMTRLAYEEHANLKVYGEVGNLEFGGKKIAFVHYPYLAKAMASEGTHDLVFYGHSHKPWEETVGRTKLVNPGNLANIFYRPTFAIYDADHGKLSLVILDTV